MELIMLALLVALTDVFANHHLYNEITLIVSAFVVKESVKVKMEKTVVDIINKEESGLIKYAGSLNSLNIIVNKFKICQILISGLIRLKSIQRIKSIRLLVKSGLERR